MDKIKNLNNIVKNSKYIVFFGGAGVSTGSGIPDFRSENGIFSLKEEIPPEEILSHNFFLKHPDLFYDFYRKTLLHPKAPYNACHAKLAQLEQLGILKAVITQNIDGLHEKAGSKEVINLHGTILDNHCIKCGKYYSLEEIMNMEVIPYCSCSGIIKPDVVLYGEALPEDAIKRAIYHIAMADTIIIGGTSLKVYPAAGLIEYFNGKNIVLINKDHLNIANVTLEVNDKIEDVMKKIEL